MYCITRWKIASYWGAFVKVENRHKRKRQSKRDNLALEKSNSRTVRPYFQEMALVYS
jgi:hypothetical protein